jgi:hypothetical protein
MTGRSGSLIGFGLDAQYSTRYPLGMEGLCDAYRSRLSHLSVVSLADATAAQWFMNHCAKDLPIVHHLNGVAPADPDGPHLRKLAELDRISDVLQPLWTCEDVGIWSIGPYAIPYFAPPIFESEIADLIAERIRQVRDASRYGYGAELPACPFTVGSMPLGAFFERIVEKSGCHMILDASHLFSYAIAKSIDPSELLSTLPLHAVREMHVSGGVLSHDASNRYIDTHSDPVLEEVLTLATEVVFRCPLLQCVTYEIGVGLTYGDIARDFDLLESCLAAAHFEPFAGVSSAGVS